MWIVNGAEKDLITLVSSKSVDGILPVGSYLTINSEDGIKHILLVEQSHQKSLFEPSPLVVDANLPVLTQDQECKNIIRAREIRQYPLRSDGLFSFIKPNQTARRTTQQEINEIFVSKKGYPVFLATNFLSQNSVLREESKNLIHVKIPFESLYLQTMICGQTGSGKTVAMKFLIEQFLSNERGAVLAINVKGIDLLTMDQATTIKNPKLKKQIPEEWNAIGLKEEELGEFSIYVPSTEQKHKEGVNQNFVRPITLKTRDLEPTALLGVLQNVTDRAAEALPDIFRYWKERIHNDTPTFRNFIGWFKTYASKDRDYSFPKLSQVDEEGTVPLHPGTIAAILRSLEAATMYFDHTESNCVAIREENIMIPGKLSVIDLSNKDTIVFGAILLRHLISKIYDAKARLGKYDDLPVLLIIDEVHQFYGSNASIQALEQLNAIARMGRSERIGVIFASQNPEDLPRGLTSIVNTRIFFRTLGDVGRKFDVKNLSIDLTSLESGYAVMSNVSFPQIRFVKFPIPLRGVVDA